MDKVFTISFLVAAVAAGAPLLFGTLGEILTEKSGNQIGRASCRERV